MSQNWTINPATGDYVISGGAPVQTDNLKIPAYMRLKVKRTQWLYAPNDEYGADFYLIKKKRNGVTSNRLEIEAAKALQPLADDGRADEIVIDTVEEQRHGLGLSIKITDAGGKTDQLDIDPLGV